MSKKVFWDPYSRTMRPVEEGEIVPIRQYIISKKMKNGEYTAKPDQDPAQKKIQNAKVMTFKKKVEEDKVIPRTPIEVRSGPYGSGEPRYHKEEKKEHIKYSDSSQIIENITKEITYIPSSSNELLTEDPAPNFSSNAGTANPMKGRKKDDDKKKGSNIKKGAPPVNKDDDQDTNTVGKDIERQQEDEKPIVQQTKVAPGTQQQPKATTSADQIDKEAQQKGADDIISGTEKTPVIIDPSLADTALNISNSEIKKNAKAVKGEQDPAKIKESVAYKHVKRIQKSKVSIKKPTHMDDITIGSYAEEAVSEDFLAKKLHKQIDKATGLAKKGVKKVIGKAVQRGKDRINNIRASFGQRSPQIAQTASAPQKAATPTTPPSTAPSTVAHAKATIAPKKPTVAANPNRKVTYHGPRASQISAKNSKSSVDIPSDPAKVKELLKKGQLPVRARRITDSYNQVRNIMEAEVARHSLGGGKRRVSVESDHIDHPVESLRKAISLGTGHIKHKNGESTEVHSATAHKLLSKYDSLKKPHEKEEFVRRVHHSKKSMEHYIAGHPEQKEDNSLKTKIAALGATGGISA